MTIRPGRAIGPYLTLLSLVAAASTFLAHSTGEDSQAPSARPAMTAANDAQLEACNRKLGPGDICVVQPGTYATPINPSRSGSAQARITYACPSWRDHPCIIDTAGADALTLGRTGARGALSHVTVDGFTFQNGLVRASGTGSSGIVLDHVTTRDPDELRPCATVSTEGGDGTLIAHFDFRMPPKSSRLPGAEAGCDVIHVAANVAGNGAGDAESHTTLSDGILRGGWNALEVGRCSDCTLDGVRIAGAKNHTLSVGASGSSTTRLTIKNSIVMASTGFREPIPFVAWEVAGLTLVNDAFITGFAIPAMGDASIRHEQTVKGPVTIRNCIFYSDRGRPFGLVNNGTVDTRNPIEWNIDYNAYVGAGSLQGPLWVDSRDCSLDLEKKLSGPGCPEKSFAPTAAGGVNADWQALGFDRHSIVFEDTDLVVSASAPAAAPGSVSSPSTTATVPAARDSKFPVRSTLWGSTAPFGGAMVECFPAPNRFMADARWGGGLRMGDRLEYDWDGTVRTITSVSPGGACGQTQGLVAVEFAPAIEPQTALKASRWFLSWGAAYKTPALGMPPASTFMPRPGALVIDRGDDSSCGHAIAGKHCDIGPREAAEEVSQEAPRQAPKGGS